MSTKLKKIVLAYSGGLDTSVILKWLIETYGCEVVAYAADVGQGEELDPVDGRARDTGASEVFIEDLREEFVADFVFPMMRAGAIYEGTYLLGTSIARPCIAKRQVEIAHETGADAVAHGATGKAVQMAINKVLPAKDLLPMTSDEISSPRCAGRQCITTASFAALSNTRPLT
jgi:argininosuccinate synthase